MKNKQKMRYLFKILIVFLCIVVYNFAAAARKENSASHSVTFGVQGSREVHLARYIITEKFKPVQTLDNDFVYKPKPLDMHYLRTITRVVITDQYTNGNGGYATLKDGGPSTNFVVVNLKSQRNHGYNFIIDLYGI